VTQNTGELTLLDWLLKVTTTPENLTLKLFKNDYTPTATTTLGDLTECDFAGYSSKTLTRSSWASSTSVSGKAYSTYPQQTWTGTTGTANTIYGYYVVGATSGTLLWAERLATPRSMADTVVYDLTPTMTLDSAA
jgi:hypothetical protein